jgi:hypothetical protein
MMEKRKDFTIKHREDVIDSIHLRAKEKRVLIGLLIILICTIAYENGNSVFNYFVSEDFATPELGERKSITIKPDMIKKLVRHIDPVKSAFPQFSEFLGEKQAELVRTMTIAAVPKTREQATKDTLRISENLWKFVTHPVLTQNDELVELQKYLRLVQKKMKTEFKADFEIMPIDFERSEKRTGANIKRSLFDYEIF